jgi:ABC-2 type transport system permease protein
MVARRTARPATRSALLWGAVFGLFVTSSALGYSSIYKTAAQRLQLARTLGADPGLSALLGPAHRIQTVAGFVEWRSLGLFGVVGAVWGLLLSSRLLRGEEDAGRLELLLAGRTTRRGAAMQQLLALGGALVVLWSVAAVVTVSVGQSGRVGIPASRAVLFALASVAGAAMFLGVGTLTSQLAATRRQAAGFAGLALGICYGARMVADSSAGLDWLRWVTPLGWVEQLQPLTAPDPWPLAAIGSLTIVASAFAVVLAGRRDLGASTLPDRPRARARTGLLSGAAGLTLRVGRPVLAGWLGGITVTGLVVGLVSASAGSALTSSSGVEKVISRLGVTGRGATAYLGIAFLIVAVLVALTAAGQLSAARAEEADGRLDHLLSATVSRGRWLGSRVAVTVATCVAAGLLAGLAAWVGATSQGAGVALASLLAAGLNVAGPAVVLLGIGFGALGVWPRGAATLTYGVLLWSFLADLIGGIINANHWILDTSVFHQIAAAPAVGVRWASFAALLALGAGGVTIGAVSFERRDIVGA